VPYTVAEIVDGMPVPYPNAQVNMWSVETARDSLVSVQSVVVDPEGFLWLLDTGSLTFPRLRGHHSTHAEDGFRAVIQGVVREDYVVGADGIAISPAGDRLYYCPLSSRRLCSISTAALRDRDLPEADVASYVRDHGDKAASDGLETDADGAVYATAYEHSAVVKRAADGQWSTVRVPVGAAPVRLRRNWNTDAGSAPREREILDRDGRI
jgi:sugar lactone lactonase YvrE